MPSWLELVPDPRPEPALALDDALLRYEAALVANFEAWAALFETLDRMGEDEVGAA